MHISHLWRQGARRHRQLKANCGKSRRQGVATVEVAICLPVLLVFTLATMDLCSLLFLKETATIAAYEAARQGVGKGRTDAFAIARGEEFLNDRGIVFQGGAITVGSPSFDTAAALENVTVTVALPCDGNLIAPGGLYGGWNVTAQVTMRKEYSNTDD